MSTPTPSYEELVHTTGRLFRWAGHAAEETRKANNKQAGKMLAIGIILYRGNKIALSERLSSVEFAGQIQGPGGKVDDTDSTLEQAAQRELIEETGIAVDRCRFHYITSVNQDSYAVAFFKLNVSTIEEPRNMEPHKHADWKWYTVEEALQLNLMSGLRAALETWRF